MFNTIKTSFVGIALLASLGSGAAMAQAPAAEAQTGAPPVVVAPHHQHGFMQALNLSPDQQSQIKGFMHNFRAERKADRQAFQSNLKLLLTQDQYARYQAHQAEVHQRWQAMRHTPQAFAARPHNRARRHHDWVAQHLQLSQEQRAQLQAYRESNVPRIRAQRRELMAQIRTVLTPGQQAQLDQMRSRHHGGHYS